MVPILIKTSDDRIWNKTEVCFEIGYAMSRGLPICLDFMHEGPDLHSLDLLHHIDNQSQKYNYDKKNITILTGNILADHPEFNLYATFPMHLVKNTFEYDKVISKKNRLKHFGLFVGRGNSPRLFLSAYLWNHYKESTVHTNHFDLHNEFYASNVGLERLMFDYGKDWITSVANYLEQCPINVTTIPIDKSSARNPAQQLLDKDKENFLSFYEDFFVEIVCETFYSGRTFFPTEKTWRPILLKTPFIVQGPVGFLSNLKKLGFRTFDSWWDESYDQDPHAWASQEICRVIDSLAEKSCAELHGMYDAMKPVLDHNQARLKHLLNNPVNNVFG